MDPFVGSQLRCLLWAGAQGNAKRFSASSLPALGRPTLGRLVITTNEGDQLVGLHVVGLSGLQVPR